MFGVDSGLRRTIICRPAAADHPEEGSMKYLCLVYREEKIVDAMPKSEFDAFVGEHRADDAVLRESGHGILSEGLQPVQTATTVRVRRIFRPTARRLTSCPAG
jgi:hypothetical protein